MINHQMKINDLIEVEIKKIGINGEGIGYYNRLTVFVDHALPGETVIVRVREIYPNRIVGDIEKIKNQSPDRLEVLYPEYDACGAYSMQHMTYKRSLTLKRDIIVNALNHYVKEKINYKKIKPMIGMKEPFGYRNKVSLPIRRINGKNKFGLYAEKSNEFIPVNDSPVQNPIINKIIQYLETILDEYHFDAYISKTKQGFIKSVVVRRAHYSGETQISFLLMRKFDKVKEVVEKLVNKFPEVVSVYVFYTNKYKEQVFFSKQFELIYGKLTITEKLNNQFYHLYPEAFFQLNTEMADIFYKKMKSLAQLKKDDIVVDAYAGIAPVSHYVYDACQKVYAIEIEEKSVKSAKESLKRNRIFNVEVIQNDFSIALKNLKNIKIDVMFFDPPRTGLGLETINQVIKYLPKKIVYGSCNPSTLAKDIAELVKYYNVVEIQPLDMFPYTPLVESVTLLELKK